MIGMPPLLPLRPLGVKVENGLPKVMLPLLFEIWMPGGSVPMRFRIGIVYAHWPFNPA